MNLVDFCLKLYLWPLLANIAKYKGICNNNYKATPFPYITLPTGANFPISGSGTSATGSTLPTFPTLPLTFVRAQMETTSTAVPVPAYPTFPRVRRRRNQETIKFY